MHLIRGRGGFQPFSLSLAILVASLLCIRVNGQGNTGLPRLSTATETKPTATHTGTTTGTQTGLPTLGSTSTTFPIPTATVPPTSNAPYMKQSNLPEGTVFICVGAILGFVGLSVLAWRGMVAWSINRSVRRAAYEQTKLENKALLRRSSKRSSRRRSSGRRRRSRRGSRGTSMTLEKLTKPDRRSHLSSTNTPATRSSLFFSPTAATGGPQSMNRMSTYLPAGYYAASNTALGASQSQINLGRSPPGTPTPPASRGGFDVPFNRSSHHLGASTSSLNLTSPPQGRAPSAYLEDLFETHDPAQFPDRDTSS